MWLFNDGNRNDKEINRLERRIQQKVCDIEKLKEGLERAGKRKDTMIEDICNIITRYGTSYGIKCYKKGDGCAVRWISGADEDWNRNNIWMYVMATVVRLLDHYEYMLEDKKKERNKMVRKDKFYEVNKKLALVLDDLNRLKDNCLKLTKENTDLRDKVDMVMHERGQKLFLKRLEESESKVKELEKENECLIIALKKVG